ncbi:hypothetical protein PY730_27850 (plasmid) [Klebsiella pneumoniae]|nr:hypothetical protein PY730_27850 [Klebsiella pneumoniae]
MIIKFIGMPAAIFAVSEAGVIVRLAFSFSSENGLKSSLAVWRSCSSRRFHEASTAARSVVVSDSSAFDGGQHHWRIPCQQQLLL